MRKFIIVTCMSGCLFLAGHLIPLIAIDPLNVSRLELSDNEFYIREMRFQSAGIINKIDFDSVIIGSSMAENFQPQKSSKVLGGAFQNLSLSGSLLSERKVVLEYLFSKKEISTVLISIDGVTRVQRNAGIPLDAWSQLYNDKYYDDFRVYLSRKFSPYLSCHSSLDNTISHWLFGNCPHEKIRLSLEELTEWQSDPQQNSRFGGIEAWLKHKNNQQVSSSIKLINNAIATSSAIQGHKKINSENAIYDANEFSQNISPIIHAQPDTRFILFFPPYSVFHHAVTKSLEPDVYLQYLELVKALVLETRKFPNAELYWFQDKGFTRNIENYKDLTHYHQDINNLILENFSRGKSRLTEDNYLTLLDSFEQQVAATDLVKLTNALNIGD